MPGGRPPAADAAGSDILLEMRPMGPQIRVAAIDVETGVEVVLVVAAGVSRDDVTRLARRKLSRKINTMA